MRHLVKDRSRAVLASSIGRARPEDVRLGERYAAGILHRPCVELWDEQLVVLPEHVRVVEVALEEVESLFRYLEDLVGVEILRE